MMTAMSDAVRELAERVKALPPEDLEEFLAWLAAYDLERADAWDRKIELDAQQGGRLNRLVEEARADIAAGRVKPLDKALDD